MKTVTVWVWLRGGSSLGTSMSEDLANKYMKIYTDYWDSKKPNPFMYYAFYDEFGNVKKAILMSEVVCVSIEPFYDPMEKERLQQQALKNIVKVTDGVNEGEEWKN